MAKSSFCGVIDEFPLVRVDNFENAGRTKVGAYFLSHCHSDHTQGLYSSELIEALEHTGACIYMSVASAAIVNDEANDKRLMKFVRPLESVRQTEILIPEHKKDDREQEHLYVTLLPAAHCLGSVMFLFENTKKAVLYTGDFRISTSDVERMTYFHKNGSNVPLKIDAMYVDTTFIDKRYLTFPKRSESIEIILDEIGKHLRRHKNNGRVALHTSAKYGYEFVFNEIHNKLGLDVYVDDSRWKLYSKIPKLVYGVTNSLDGVKIHNCRYRWSENLDHRSCVPIKNETSVNNNTNERQECGDGTGKLQYLYIHFSALKWADFEVEGETFNKIADNRIDVCFATHCGSTEVRYFVDYFSPRKVVGFPNKYQVDVSPVKNVDTLVGFPNRCKVDASLVNNVDTLLVSPKRRKVAKVEPQEKRASKELLKKFFQF